MRYPGHSEKNATIDGFVVVTGESDLQRTSIEKRFTLEL